MWWCICLIPALSRQRKAELYDFFFYKNSWQFYFHISQWKLYFLSHFSPSKLCCQERGSLPCHAARRHSGSALCSPGETEQEIQNWWRDLLLSIWPSHTKPSGYHHIENRRYYHWRPRNHGHVASHRWPHSRSRSPRHHPRRRKAHHWYRGNTYCFQATRKWFIHSGWQGWAKDKNQCNDGPDKYDFEVSLVSKMSSKPARTA